MEVTIKEYRSDLKEFTLGNYKKSCNPYKTKAKELLGLSDAELDEWRQANNAYYSYQTWVYKQLRPKEEKAKYDRIKRKAEDYEIGKGETYEFTEDEELFIERYEEENDIADSILDR